jgi:hypothetical protein
MQWYTNIESLITKIGLAAVFFLGLAYAAYAGLKHFGAKYLDNHFAQTLQAAQQDFNRQLKEPDGDAGRPDGHSDRRAHSGEG